MKHFFLILLYFITADCVSQVNYIIDPSNNLEVIPAKIFNSNDGNLLLLNAEQNWDAGSYHILKVRSNGDTIFCKSITSENIYVTSIGNILTNETVYSIPNNKYTNSSIRLYNKNLLPKWEIDLSQNISFWVSPPIANNFLEINPNHFICSVTSYTNIGGGMGDEKTIEFDSLGNILDIRNSINVQFKYFGKSSNSLFSFSSNNIKLCDINIINGLRKSKVISGFYKLTNALLYNSKIYTLSKDFTSFAPMISCLDTTGNLIWSKKITTMFPLQNFNFTDIIESDSKLICQYKSDSTSLLLNIDTLGNITSSYQFYLDVGNKTTNLTFLNDSLYTTNRFNFSNTNLDVGLIKMDKTGYYNCSINTFAITTNITTFTPTTFNYYLSTNTLISSLNNVSSGSIDYSINISYGCFQNTTSLDYMNGSHDDYEIYPNPTNSKIQISTNDLANNDIFIRITDITGRVILQENYKKEIDVISLQNGIYFLNIYDKEKLIATKKIIKQ